MFARFFANRRVRKATAAHLIAYRAACDAKSRRDTRDIGRTLDALTIAQNERLAAELALSKLEGFGALRAAR